MAFDGEQDLCKAGNSLLAHPVVLELADQQHPADRLRAGICPRQAFRLGNVPVTVCR